MRNIIMQILYSAPASRGKINLTTVQQFIETATDDRTCNNENIFLFHILTTFSNRYLQYSIATYIIGINCILAPWITLVEWNFSLEDGICISRYLSRCPEFFCFEPGQLSAQVGNEVVSKNGRI